MSQKTAAEWLPSRFRLPLFKLIGLVMAVLKGPVQPPSGIMLMRDADQSPLENFTMSGLVSLMHVLACFAALEAWTSKSWLAALGAFPLAFLSMQLTSIVFSIAMAPVGFAAGKSNEVQNVLHHGLLLVLCCWFLDHSSPVLSTAGVAWLIFLGLNIISAVVLLVLAPRIAALEQIVWPAD